MADQRWTIRGVDSSVVAEVRRLQAETGFTLGEIVSLAIEVGLPSAIDELTEHSMRTQRGRQELLRIVPEVRALMEAIQTALKSIRAIFPAASAAVQADCQPNVRQNDGAAALLDSY
jgi:hypothetical protein